MQQLTKSMVADELLVDFDFVVCPRCGSDIDQSRSGEGKCYLCLESYEAVEGDKEIELEIERVERQISETYELIDFDNQRARKEGKKIEDLKSEKNKIEQKINQKTKSYISENADKIEAKAENIAKSEERVKKLSEYVDLIDKLNNTDEKISSLEYEIERKEEELERSYEDIKDVIPKIEFFENKFREYLDRLDAPEFEIDGDTYIDRDTLIPYYKGKNANRLSPGLTVLVNTAYISAHQVTSIKYDLPIPNIVIADSISGPIGSGTDSRGEEDLDPQRLTQIFQLLRDLASEHDIQVIIADNNLPPGVEPEKHISFSEDSRLIPAHLLED